MKPTLLATALLLCLALPPTAIAGKAPASQALAADTPSTTAQGNTFVAPKDWTLKAQGAATLLSPPEGDSMVALIDIDAADADAAVKAAWAASGSKHAWPLKLASDQPSRDGWEKVRTYDYETSVNDKRVVFASAAWNGAHWAVVLVDADQAVMQKRGAQFNLILDRFLPKGHERESFAGRTAHKLDAARVEALKQFVTNAQRELGVPGVALGLIQDDKVVYAGGLGVRELGKPEPVDADTLFMMASNTKAMTTLMLARLVDAGKLQWTTPVTSLLPGFALGNADTTSHVQVQHLVCACTGLPRQDFEWLMEFRDATPASTLRSLAKMQPTSDFGALFQYSNPLASAGGYVGAHVAHPDMELGAAYDRTMQELVFAPLGMQATTFDFSRALHGNHAGPHAWNIDGQVAIANMDTNYSVVPVRPAGGSWSNVHDMLRYVQMELDSGLLPNGTRLVSEDALLERRKKKVAMGNDATYGMGLMVDTTWGVPVVHHGGSLIGYKSDMIWLPEHNVGAVILTNSDTGRPLLAAFRRRLLEVLFDGKPQAADDVASNAKDIHAWLDAERKRLTVPVASTVLSELAPRYRNASLGEVSIRSEAGRTVLDFGEWQTDLASRHNDDGTDAIVTTAPGMNGIPLVIDNKGPVRKLILRDDQHDYEFQEVASAKGGR